MRLNHMAMSVPGAGGSYLLPMAVEVQFHAVG